MGRYVLALVLVFLVGTPARAGELEERADIEAKVIGLLYARDFAGLEAMAENYRSSRARTSSGLYKLTLFYSGIFQAFCYTGTEDRYWDKAERIAQDWVDRYPQSATAHLAFAQVLRNHARSFGIASSHADHDAFLTHMKRTRLYLVSHAAIAQQDPRWYEMMIGVARAEHWPEASATKLIEQAMDGMPWYYPIYFAAVDYFLSASYDGAGRIERFTRAAVDRTQATEGRGLYARIYWYASQTEYGDQLFVRSLLDWDNMKTGMDDVLRQFPDSWNIANFLQFTCLKGDDVKVQDLAGRMRPADWSLFEELGYADKCRSLRGG
ncbi:MAG TPA: hypothetical protein VJV39_19675 [Dongiaceae bacterium]|nr:hypothetical protein [Dongiaceae bacterium]